MKKPLKIKLLALLTRIDTLPKQGSELTDAMPSLKEAAAAVVSELAKEPRAAASAEASVRGHAFAAWCAKGLIDLRTTPASLQKWALCYDALTGIDGHTPEQIAAVWTFARSHDFYRKVVLSPLKLRQLDSAGVRWFDRLTLAMENKPATKPATVQITKAGVTK